jgi:PKD repeat protein
MLRRWFVLCAVVTLFGWGCGGPSEEPKGEPQEAPKAAPAAKAQPVDIDEGYEELDVWIEAEPDEGPPPLRVHFTSEVESDEGDEGPFQYKWDFGDGKTSAAPNPVHTYKEVGEYTVTLVANDDKGNNGSDEIDVWVEEEEE